MAPRKHRSLMAALAGKPEHPTLRTQLTQVYGRSARGGPNTARAAELLGVSQRTVQRWLKAGKLPESAHGQTAASDLANWRESPAGRAQLLGPRRSERFANQGFIAKIAGTFRISGDKRPNRTVSATVDPEHARDIIEALRAGDDQGAHAALEDAFGDAFGGSVSITVDGIEISHPDGLQ